MKVYLGVIVVNYVEIKFYFSDYYYFSSIVIYSPLFLLSSLPAVYFYFYSCICREMLRLLDLYCV